MIENVTKAVGPIAQEAVKKTSGKFLDEMFETFLRPKFEKMKNKPKNTEDILEILEEYYQKAYNKNKYMNTIVFKQETKSLDELYIPLTIVKNGKNSKEKIVINNNISNIFETRKRILIIDSAGMGKSTLTKFLYLKWLNTDFDIPFLIELRKVKNGMSLLDHICQELCLSEKRLSANDIKFLIERGDFIFFLDGYDEIPKENKEEVTKEIEKFLLEFNKNSFMLTSREEDSLNVFSEFEKYHIRPLEKKEAYELIRKYDNYGQVAENLICEIENNEQYEILEEFLENPLMVSLLYLTYHYKGIVQYKKPVFYRQVYDALYEGHDIVKGDGEIHKKKTGLDIDGFNDLLSAMGYLSIYKGKVSFDRNNLKQLIKEALDIYWHEEEIDVNDVIHDILYAIPLFIEEGLEIKWAHKSFAEYFAANFICYVEKEHENTIVESMMKTTDNNNLYNTIDFCYDMDAKLAQEVIVYRVVTDYIKFYDEISKGNNDELLPIKAYYRFVNDNFFFKFNNETNGDKKKSQIKGEELISAMEFIQEHYSVGKLGGLSFVSRNSNVVRFVFRKPMYCATKLLFDKGCDIFSEVRCKEYSLKFLGDLKEGAYLWGEKANNILNTEENDRALTSYIHHRSYETGISVLDYDKCKRKKEEIEKAIKKLKEICLLFRNRTMVLRAPSGVLF